MPSEGVDRMTVIRRDEWIKDTCDRAHGENWGGDHRSGFCKACADVYLTLNHVAADVRGAVHLTPEQWERVLWWLHKPVPPGPGKAMDEKIIRAINAQRGQ